jgi:hypothetical protein
MVQSNGVLATLVSLAKKESRASIIGPHTSCTKCCELEATYKPRPVLRIADKLLLQTIRG